jgi:hypothetical protein
MLAFYIVVLFKIKNPPYGGFFISRKPYLAAFLALVSAITFSETLAGHGE